MYFAAQSSCESFCYNWVLAGTLGDLGISIFSILKKIVCTHYIA